MPRKPNYRFERYERERAKAQKKAERLQARADRRSAAKTENQAAGESDDETPDRHPVDTNREKS